MKKVILFSLFLLLLAVSLPFGQEVVTVMHHVPTQAATPTFSPVAGAVDNPTTVTMSSASSGCTDTYIHHNTTGSPVVSDPTGTYSVTGAVTLYAAVIGCPGFSDSAVGSAAYTIASSGMAYQVASYREANSTSGTTIATASTTNVPTGATLIACVGNGNLAVSGVTDGVSNTFSNAVINNATYRVELWYKLNATANAAATFTASFGGTASFPIIMTAVFTGPTALDRHSCYDGTCTAGGTGTNRTAANVTTTAANELLAYCTVENYNHTRTNQNGFTVISPNPDTLGNSFAWKSVTSIASYPNGNVETVDSQADNIYYPVFATFK